MDPQPEEKRKAERVLAQALGAGPCDVRRRVRQAALGKDLEPGAARPPRVRFVVHPRSHDRVDLREGEVRADERQKGKRAIEREERQELGGSLRALSRAHVSAPHHIGEAPEPIRCRNHRSERLDHPPRARHLRISREPARECSEDRGVVACMLQGLRDRRRPIRARPSDALRVAGHAAADLAERARLGRTIRPRLGPNASIGHRDARGCQPADQRAVARIEVPVRVFTGDEDLSVEVPIAGPDRHRPVEH
jgi:hypothetical protein